jgi:methanogenic corrinoid protein MtbC1
MLARETRVQPPALDSYSNVPLFNTKAVVHQTSVPAPTLRAWERRYGVLAPRRGENDYRLYSERDIATVAWLRERVEGGMTISQAIALLRSLEPARRRGRKGAQTAPAPTVAQAEAPAHLALDELVAALIDRFVALDEPAAKRLTMQALAVYAVEEVCLRLFTPALFAIGQQWSEGRMSVTVEHFASALIRSQLENLYQLAAREPADPLVLVGCAPGELHEIGALMLALFLRRRGLRVVYLGQNMEAESLIRTVQAAKPACVLLSATLPAQAAALVDLSAEVQHALKPQPLIYFGGQGFAADPAQAERISAQYLHLNALEAAQELRKRLPA